MIQVVVPTFLKNHFFYGYEYFAYMYACIYAMCMTGALRGQKKALNPLKLESRTLMSCHVGPGIECLSSGRAATTLNH